ncbi:MAG: YggS family pyridoxal phosphate-dependent enzyme [Parafilimonas sp.]
MVNINAYKNLLKACAAKNVTLVAVSKTKPLEDIRTLYNLGQRDFGENYVQEIVEKQKHLPEDIRWHFIGHLQSNKVKQIISFVHLIQGVDSLKLLTEINKQSEKIDKTTNCLLQIHIATEETKFGLDENELNEIIRQFKNFEMKNINIIGLMGMASNTDDMQQVRKEFNHLKSLQTKYAQPQTLHFKLQTLSMGMTADYTIAIEEGSTIIRVGSLIFGNRS